MNYIFLSLIDKVYSYFFNQLGLLRRVVKFLVSYVKVVTLDENLGIPYMLHFNFL